MASTKTRSTVDPPDVTLPGFAGRAPTLRRPRNLPGAVLGILLVVVCSLVVAALASSAGHRTQVLVITKPVAAGTTITADDLQAAGVAADHQVRGIPASRAGAVIGRVTADNLVPGTLLVQGELATGPLLAKGFTVVGLALKPGFLPTGLTTQDAVTVIDTPMDAGAASTGAGGAGPAGSVLVGRATVYSVGSSPDGQSTLVSVEVPASDAPAVAEANAQASISLVLLGS